MLGVGRGGPLGREDAAVIAGTPGVAVGGREDDGRERDAWVVLAGVNGVGPVSFARLLASYGRAADVLEAAGRPGAVAALVAASRGPDAGASLSAATAAEIVAVARDPGAPLAVIRASGVRVLTLADGAYPSRLRRIELPPPVLFLRGEPAALDRPRSVAIVGTRRPTGAGRAIASEIAEVVGALGATIVSGLALGIDAAAHAAAVRGHAPTVAVIGGGHDRLYPAVHRGLARAIVDDDGAIVSEFAPDIAPSRGTFPRRNRLISGLADATIVVEAGARSGALTTAAWALEQGRGLHIVPGRVGDPAVAGSLAFLREAAPEARIVSGIADLVEDLGLLRPVAGAAAAPLTSDGTRALLRSLGDAERAVARAVAAGVGSVDELVAATGQAGATVLGALTSLELRGLVLETFGRYRPTGALALVPAVPRRRGSVRGPAAGRAA